MRFDQRLRAALAVPALALVALAGCGGGNDNEKAPQVTSTAPGAVSSLRLTADPGGQLRFDKKTLDASAGKVTIVMKNRLRFLTTSRSRGPASTRWARPWVRAGLRP